MKKALVCGAGGFIGHHLVNRLKKEGYWVRGVDQKRPEFSPSQSDEFLILDLREAQACRQAFAAMSAPFDEVYQLAADMGGMGFIHSAECEIMRNSALININMIAASAEHKASRYLLSSSACVYKNMRETDDFITEENAYPALPDNEYGWEKLYAERMALAYSRRFPIAVRIARFQNCYGPEGTWDGGREKAPAALCRKVASAKGNGEIEVWGDGSAMRSYTYVDDLVDGIKRLMDSDLKVPVNIGSEEFASVTELANTVIKVSGKNLKIRYIDGPVGVQARNHTFDKIKSLGWRAQTSLESGIEKTYHWIAQQVEATQAKGK